MSIEKQPGFDPPPGYNPAAAPQYLEEKPRSSKKWWIIGGCGCFSMIILCGLGIGGIIFFVARPYVEFQQECIQAAESSPRVVELLGDNPRVNVQTQNITQTQEGSVIKWVERLEISGDDNKGTLIIRGTFEPFTTWVRDSLELEVDGETIDLGDPLDEFDLDIDEGFGDEGLGDEGIEE